MQKSTSSRTTISTGRDCFIIFYRSLENAIQEKDSRGKPSGRHPKILEIINDRYVIFYKNHNQDLGHYFRLMYRIFLYIDNSEEINKLFYAKILRSQISDYELAILFYNGISENGRNKFKPLIEKYSLFDNLPESLIFDKSHKQFYDEIAFGVKEK
ncbi:putative phage abortive infection protein [Pacificispira spongiicola]|uniref:putative phage abortive infection protein n=1 Tax=Pacificispira spongiicola TaxID=2729598 RepID=UPI001D0C1711